MHRRRLLAAPAAVAGLVLVAASTGRFLEGYDVPVGEPAAAPDALVYAAGRALLVDGSQEMLDHVPDSLASTRGGLFYLAEGRLYRWRGPDAARGTSADAAPRDEKVADVGGPTELLVSADGRFLAYMDFEHGPWTWRGGHIAETVVVDTTTGEQVVRDASPNGSRSDDLDDAYAEVAPSVRGFDKGHVYADGGAAGGTVRIDLDGDLVVDWLGRPVVADNTLGGTPVGVMLDEGRATVVPSVIDRLPGRLSPDEEQVVFGDDGIVWRVESAGGAPQRVLTGSAYTSVGGWLDERTFVVIGRDLDGGAPSDTAAVLTCTVTGGCAGVDGPAGSADAPVVLAFGGLPH